MLKIAFGSFRIKYELRTHYMKKNIIPVLFVSLILTSCVSTKKHKLKIAEYDAMKVSYEKVDLALNQCLSEKTQSADKIKSLEEELTYVKSVSTNLLKQLNDFSILTNAQADNLKTSLDNINAKDTYIKNLQSSNSRKDSLNLALVLNLKSALKDVNDDDVQIKVEGSAVFISISDKMLYNVGSYELSLEAKAVLSKVADVVKAQPNIQFMVEGHTDNSAISKNIIKDNWDLSVLRATSIVRILQTEYGIEPSRMIAAGRSEFKPMASNDTEEGKSQNRRTRIVILPELDQFFKLLEAK